MPGPGSGFFHSGFGFFILDLGPDPQHPELTKNLSILLLLSSRKYDLDLFDIFSCGLERYGHFFVGGEPVYCIIIEGCLDSNSERAIASRHATFLANLATSKSPDPLHSQPSISVATHPAT
jgi:hypothetical protein